VNLLEVWGAGSSRRRAAWECAMRRYAAYVGEPSKRGGYRSQKLPGGDHSALGDALATLQLIEEMATG
jgi:DNA polymerase-3 subunit epsilon